MSIKSQKSLNEECSEIWERSYSVRSVSEDSSSCEDENAQLCRELLSAMTPAVLSKLRRSFTKGHKRTLKDVSKRVEQIMRVAAAEEGIVFINKEPRREDVLWTDEQTFVTALEKIFGHHKFTTHAHKLFQALDPFLTRQVCWSDLLERLVAVGARRTRSRAERWSKINEEVQTMTQLKHCKRETIIKLVNICTDSSFCFAAVSKGGRVGIYRELQLLHQYELWYHRSGISNRVKNSWVTDATYLNDVQCLLISASDRSLTIYDASILTHTLIYCITGLPNIPTCLAYDPSLHKSDTSELIIGDERGNITRLKFLQPQVSLLYKKYADKVNSYFWMELASAPHDVYCSISTWSRVHSRSVRRVQYSRRQDAIISCSHDSSASVVLRHQPEKMPDYVFKVPRGVTCFHVVPSLHLLVTGSLDGFVRFWEVTQSAPFAKIQVSSRNKVQDVVVMKELEIVLACCKNCWVDIWDLYEECLLQTIKIKYPFLGILGKKVESGSYCIHPGPPRKKPLEEDASSSPPADPGSRRSSVYRGDTGGLILQEIEEDALKKVEKSEAQFCCSELLLSCCDYVYTLKLNPDDSDEEGEVPPPPGNTRRARRPSCWDLSSDVVALGPIVADSPRKQKPSSLPATPRTEPDFLSPESAKSLPQESSLDLDDLLENAGLQGILEKDFVLMMGLKHDLNQKLAELGASMDQMAGPVSAGAAYLALKLHEPAPMEPVDEMIDRYNEVVSLFPPSSTIASSPRSPRTDSSRTYSRRSKSTKSS